MGWTEFGLGRNSEHTFAQSMQHHHHHLLGSAGFGSKSDSNVCSNDDLK